MSDRLGTYLNDHLAGAAAALDLVAKAAAKNRDRAEGAFFDELRAAIDEDRATLEDVMGRVGVERAGVKQAAGRVAERISRLRLHERVTGDPDLSRLMELEAIAVGVTGKLALWQSLQTVAQAYPPLTDVNFQALIGRARQQLAGIEERHRAAAQEALAG